MLNYIIKFNNIIIIMKNKTLDHLFCTYRLFNILLILIFLCRLIKFAEFINLINICFQSMIVNAKMNIVIIIYYIRINGMLMR